MNYLIFAVSSGVFFAAWQLLSRNSTLPPLILNIGMLMGGLVVSLLYGVFALKRSEWEMLGSPVVWSPIFYGALNSAGFILFLTALQKSPTLTAGSVASMITMIAFVALGGIVFYKEPVTIDRIIGFIAAFVAVYQLSK